jgi:hypothetical protein
MPAEAERLAALERDREAHARSIGEFAKALIEIDKKEALRELGDKHLDERLDRIEARLDGVFRLGWWILAAFGTSAVALIANFAFRGGFIVS